MDAFFDKKHKGLLYSVAFFCESEEKVKARSALSYSCVMSYEIMDIKKLQTLKITLVILK